MVRLKKKSIYKVQTKVAIIFLTNTLLNEQYRIILDGDGVLLISYIFWEHLFRKIQRPLISPYEGRLAGDFYRNLMNVLNEDDRSRQKIMCYFDIQCGILLVFDNIGN